MNKYRIVMFLKDGTREEFNEFGTSTTDAFLKATWGYSKSNGETTFRAITVKRVK